ncbi:hypothetical protein CMO90_02415 [Candidatus Woesearchaeota archaeon]|jgi:hypothetical protein|nr:hypothetical protein [Candidatus Woesearchaeota archaeon]|tara:strand:+ start:47 stop:499 length:453 start_codon:yes stop_codon:yes gene_type:complete
MPYSELVKFIKEQLFQGRDPRTIREYLLRREVDQGFVDAAFDKVFKTKTKKEPKTSIEKFTITGIFLMLFFLIVAAVTLYTQITPKTIVSEQIQEITFSETTICNYESSEAKYNCYSVYFESNDINCYDIKEENERDFCYRAQDFYALNV